MKLIRNGNNVRILCTQRYMVLFSYHTPVAYYDIKNSEYYKTDTYYSVTTSRHVNQFIGDKDCHTISHSIIMELI